MSTEKPPVLVKSMWRGPLTVVVVGAGGTGARVVPPLSQMLRRNDRLVIIDHDIVEDRNLARQHFTARDIGSPKAMVLATRYAREGIPTVAFQEKVSEDARATTANIVDATREPGPRPTGIVFIGCVDNAGARRAIFNMMRMPVSGISHTAWIDVGNEMRGGQVLTSLHNWPVHVPGSQIAESFNASMHPMVDAMPQLLREAPGAAEEESCRDRIDLQTVQVNHMAAGAAINALSILILGIPFTSAGAFFSTLNTMQPIPITGQRDGKLLVSTAYAIPA